jgi:predicted DNA-binding antitoxin AbrB/MazE fold protein
MSLIEAIYRRGVFEPLQPVDLPENQRVRLNVEPNPLKLQEWQEWFERVQRLQDELRQQHGEFPDSTIDIAEDRMR